MFYNCFLLFFFLSRSRGCDISTRAAGQTRPRHRCAECIQLSRCSQRAASGNLCTAQNSVRPHHVSLKTLVLVLLQSEAEKLQRLKERVETQEAKLKKIRAMRGQVDYSKLINGNLCEFLHRFYLRTVKICRCLH